ncbi:MAG: hypothetical protein J1F69_02720 [Clostridiales bacterium]|nr:hypothetical protein [Clostridiales bacterium]
MSVSARKKQAKVQTEPDTFAENILRSRIGLSSVGDILNRNSAVYTPEERCKKVTSAFRRESSVILDLGSPLYSLNGALRQEEIKTYIIKALLFIGTPPTGNGLAVLARLTEILCLHPELDLEYVIEDFAKTHYSTVDAVTRIIEKYFNIYDNVFCERVMLLTESHPFTAKDVLCDLSVFVRAKYLEAGR